MIYECASNRSIRLLWFTMDFGRAVVERRRNVVMWRNLRMEVEAYPGTDCILLKIDNLTHAPWIHHTHIIDEIIVSIYTLRRIWHRGVWIVRRRHRWRNIRWIRCWRRSTIRYGHTTLMLHRIRQLRRRCSGSRCWAHARRTYLDRKSIFIQLEKC